MEYLIKVLNREVFNPEKFISKYTPQKVKDYFGNLKQSYYNAKIGVAYKEGRVHCVIENW